MKDEFSNASEETVQSLVAWQPVLLVSWLPGEQAVGQVGFPFLLSCFFPLYIT